MKHKLIAWGLMAALALGSLTACGGNGQEGGGTQGGGATGGQTSGGDSTTGGGTTGETGGLGIDVTATATR